VPTYLFCKLTKVSVVYVGATTLSITTFGITTLSIKSVFETLSINDIQHNSTSAIKLSVAIYLLLC
jgi:hypothetical protein